MKKLQPFRCSVAGVRRATILIAGVLALQPVHAQMLEEIVVTATKRAESLQDVAISIQAVGGEAIAEFGITNFEQINVPGFKVPRAGMGDNIFMRGIGSGPNLGFEQSVPIYMNGLYFGRGRGSRAGFMDLARIEVVKGPQPTYFGKNAIAGAASLVWSQPTEEFEGYVDALYESENEEYIVSAAVSGPLSDTVRGRFAFRYRDLSDGWLLNTTTGNNEPELTNLGFRGILAWDASDTVSVTATVFQSTDEEGGRNQQASFCPASGLFANLVTDCSIDTTREGFNTFDPIGNIDTGSEVFPFPVQQGARLGDDRNLNTSSNELDLSGGSVEVQWDTAAGITITSLTGYYQFDNTFVVGGDQTPVDIADGGFGEQYDQFSQELRFQSDLDQSVTWLAGVYFDSNDNRQVTSNVGGMMSSLYVNNSEQADSWAVFAEVEFNIGESARLNLGGRYTEVDKDFSKEACRGAATSAAAPDLICGTGMFPIPHFRVTDSRTFSKFQPAISFEMDINDNILGYASFKEGFKSGGWDFGPPNSVIDQLRFDQEEVDAFELGAKMSLAGGAATLNLAVFSSEFSNLQVTAFNPILDVVNVFNAATATSQGVEAELNWAASESLTISANLTFLDSEYDDFPVAECFTTAGPPEYPTCDLSTNPNGRTRNLQGESTPYAPDFAGQLTFDWNVPISSNLEINSRLGIFTTGEYFTSGDNDPLDIQDGFTKWDLRVGIGPPDGAWEIALIGRNLSDELTCAFKGDIPIGVVGVPADPVTGAVESAHFCMTERPRTIAVQGIFRF